MINNSAVTTVDPVGGKMLQYSVVQMDLSNMFSLCCAVLRRHTYICNKLFSSSFYTMAATHHSAHRWSNYPWIFLMSWASITSWYTDCRPWLYVYLLFFSLLSFVVVPVFMGTCTLLYVYINCNLWSSTYIASICLWILAENTIWILVYRCYFKST